MKNLDLFGGETENHFPKEKTYVGPYRKFKTDSNYRLGTPEKRCKNCDNRFSGGTREMYWKCKFMGNTASEATDIRLKNVCNLWKKEK